MNKLAKTGISLAQILILVIGIVGISYAIGSEVGVVCGKESEGSWKIIKRIDLQGTTVYSNNGGISWVYDKSQLRIYSEEWLKKYSVKERVGLDGTYFYLKGDKTSRDPLAFDGVVPEGYGKEIEAGLWHNKENGLSYDTYTKRYFQGNPLDEYTPIVQTDAQGNPLGQPDGSGSAELPTNKGEGAAVGLVGLAASIEVFTPTTSTPIELTNGKTINVNSYSQNPDRTWIIKHDGGSIKVSTSDMQKVGLVDKSGKATGVLQKPTTGTGSRAGDWFLKQGWETGSANFFGHIASGLAWSITAYGIIHMIGPMFGLEGLAVDSLSKASFGGIMAGKTTYGLIKEGGWLAKEFGTKTWGMTPGQFSFVAGATVAALIFYSTYKSESQETITFECEPWQAPTKGKHCEECNEQGLPCSEYQCRSLGQACELLNKGTDEEKCAWVGREDVSYPVIKPWDDALLADYEYKPDNTLSPPDRGVIVWNKDSTTGCAKAFTPLTFGVTLDEPGQCKVDYLRKSNFEEMGFYLGGSTLFDYNHSQAMSLPGPSALKAANLTLENDGDYELYVRCQDANGNYNTANFVFKYCVEKGPDTTPVLIVTTNLLNNMPIAYNQTEVDLEVYINEPAECKWSHLDQSYDDMEEEMSCSSSVLEMNAQMLYKCSTTLTGIKSRVENKFYFRCKDQPSGEDRNVNSESYEFVLIGTQPLVINSVLPNGTIKDSTETVKVTLEAKTSAGYNEGEAVCYYSYTGDDDSYIMFFETNAHTHSQDLWLTSGDYEYSVKCIDLGGNSDIEIVEFSVESDSSSPIVVRVYHEETYLKLITDEEAECVYDTVDCSYLFDDGTKTTTVDDTDHFTDWDIKTSFYVKCQDKYGNQPPPDQCSIIVRAFNSL